MPDKSKLKKHVSLEASVRDWAALCTQLSRWLDNPANKGLLVPTVAVFVYNVGLKLAEVGFITEPERDAMMPDSFIGRDMSPAKGHWR